MVKLCFGIGGGGGMQLVGGVKGGGGVFWCDGGWFDSLSDGIIVSVSPWVHRRRRARVACRVVFGLER